MTAAIVLLGISQLILCAVVLGQGVVIQRILKRETAVALKIDGSQIYQSLRKFKRQQGLDDDGLAGV